MEDNLIRAKGFRLILTICLGSYLVIYTGATLLTDVFAVEIDGDPAVAKSIAAKYGFKVLSHLEHFGGVYEFVSNEVGDRSKRSDQDLSAELALDPRVTWVEQQRVLHRQKRVDVPHTSEEGEDEDVFTFNDPLFKNQWYLIDRGQSGGFGGHDLNVAPAWKKGLSGKGIVVTIVDDGVDHKHPDLQLNYDPKASADLNDPDDPFNDPTPNMVDPGNNHGTKCAGVVAALANNSKCGVGVAFNAKIGGIRMLDGVVTDLLESRSLLYNNQYIDVYSSSWGPKDNGSVMDGPHRYTRKALENGAKKGRGGKGSIFIWATGNGGHHGDDCNCDGYITSIYTLTVGSIASNGNFTSFGEICPSTMAVVFASGLQSNKDFAHVVTTDAGGKCTKYFVGTSTAAPLAAGCVALVLEANGNLTWRDVQHIVAETSVVPNEEEDGWTVNGGGYHVNHKFGFGAMDCSRMVEAALSWSLVQEQKSCIIRSTMKPRALMAGETITESLVTDNFCNKTSPSSDSVDRLEHVQVYVKMSHVKRGDISINITSPSGTTSNILKVRPLDTSKDGINFIFMTVHNWGESPVGRWTLMVKDNSVDGGRKVGELENWALGFNGVQGELTNHEKWRMSDGHLLKDGRIGGTKLENRRRVLEQRHLVSPRTTTHQEEQQQHSNDNDNATQNDNEGRIINEHRNINEDRIINEDNVDTFRGYKMARGQNDGDGNATDGDEEEDGDGDDDDGRHASISEDKLYNLLARLKAINRRNHLLEEQSIARRGFLGGHRSNRGRSPQWGEA